MSNFEQCLRDNPMPTKTLGNENYKIVEVRYGRNGDVE